MRALSRVVARRLPGGCCMVLALALAACVTSPTEQLEQAEKLLSGLESKGAEQYLTYELAEARQKIEEAKKFMRQDQVELAGEYLFRACQKLDSCSIVFVQMRRTAEIASREGIKKVSSELARLEEMVANLPRLTYVDQNRHDIHVYRLRRYHKDIAALASLLQVQNFPEVLRRISELDTQLQKTLVGLTNSVRVTATPVQTTRKQEIKEPPPERKINNLYANSPTR
ncbi:DUF4398 domain-containing protein [bacterium]|nr:DUF4398 domain-containing protein [bacterium]NUM75408.1 DUF4398 domain-containing protein [candidate division KSB1 bacterium]RIK79990.1 MAG: hypothetical protein DCC62_04665 [candidate division KSB1 bacterium]